MNFVESRDKIWHNCSGVLWLYLDKQDAKRIYLFFSKVPIKLLCIIYSFISVHNPVQNLHDMMNNINKFHKNLLYVMFKPSWRKHRFIQKLYWSQILILLLAGWEWVTTSAWCGTQESNLRKMRHTASHWVI